MWLKKMRTQKTNEVVKLCTLPPTNEAFEEHVKRSHFQASIWKAALCDQPPSLIVNKFGWMEDTKNKMLIPTAVKTGVAPAPPGLLQTIRCGCSSEQPCATARCGCVSSQMSCTSFCSCFTEENCCNLWTKVISRETSKDDTVSDESYDESDHDIK